MKNKFTLSLLFLSILLIVCSSACSSGDEMEETDIVYADLPSEAKQFIETYYSEDDVTKVSKMTQTGVILYEVDLYDGTEITFDSAGIWQEVDAGAGKEVPSGIIHQNILNYLNEYYSDYPVVEINKTGFGYLVELNSGLDLKFDFDGEYLGVES